MPDDASENVARLIEKHRDQLLRIIERRMPPALRATSSPEDILQIAFGRAVPKYHRLALGQAGVSEFNWLYTIVVDCVNEEAKRAMRQCRDQRKNVPLPESSSMGLVPVDQRTGPSSAFRRKERAEAAQEVLDELKPDYREILLMRSIDELKYKEIAEILQISEENAATRHHRAVREFRRLWEQRFSSSEGT